jgi:hypothetical protein
MGMSKTPHTALHKELGIHDLLKLDKHGMPEGYVEPEKAEETDLHRAAAKFPEKGPRRFRKNHPGFGTTGN